MVNLTSYGKLQMGPHCKFRIGQMVNVEIYGFLKKISFSLTCIYKKVKNFDERCYIWILWYDKSGCIG